MDEAEFFSPTDVVARLAIKAVIANRKISASDLETLFASTGLTMDRTATYIGVEMLRSVICIPAR
jgi:hypothetical protein